MERKIKDDSAELKGKWLITFNDMITLLLTFFVLVVSMSAIATGKVAGVADSARRVVGQEAGPAQQKQGILESGIPSIKEEDLKRAEERNRAKDSIDPFAYQKDLLFGFLKNVRDVEIVVAEDSFLVSMKDKSLFAPGSAELTRDGAEILKKLGSLLQQLDAFVRVEGHTDSVPTRGSKYPTNWELSMARATNIVRWFTAEAHIAPERFSAAGYADTRPRVPNDSPANREINRRIDIVLTFAKY